MEGGGQVAASLGQVKEGSVAFLKSHSGCWRRDWRDQGRVGDKGPAGKFQHCPQRRWWPRPRQQRWGWRELERPTVQARRWSPRVRGGQEVAGGAQDCTIHGARKGARSQSLSGSSTLPPPQQSSCHQDPGQAVSASPSSQHQPPEGLSPPWSHQSLAGKPPWPWRDHLS